MLNNSKGAALITGAARRIGRQLAIDLAANGYDIALHFNSSVEEAAVVAAEIAKLGRRVILLQGDLADGDVAERLVTRAVLPLGGLSVLINNSSVFEDDEIGDVSLASWGRHMDVNLRAPVMLSQAFAKALPTAATGNIINIIDQRVWKLNPQFFSYTLSKSGLWTATRTMAQALAPRIRVNAIGPGPTLPSARMSDGDFEKQNLSTLLKRGTTPVEISTAAIFILSQPALTGQMIALDGGQHLLWQTPDILEVKE